jgi:hypothetical protein
VPLLIPCPPVAHAVISPVTRAILPAARHLWRARRPVRHLAKRVASHLPHVHKGALLPVAKTGCHLLASAVLAGGLLVPPSMTPANPLPPQEVASDFPRFVTTDSLPPPGSVMQFRPSDPSPPPGDPSPPPRLPDPGPASGPVTVPEPSSTGVFAAGLVSLVLVRRLRRSPVGATIWRGDRALTRPWGSEA